MNILLTMISNGVFEDFSSGTGQQGWVLVSDDGSRGALREMNQKLRENPSMMEKIRKETFAAPGIPRRSPILVLTLPIVA